MFLDARATFLAPYGSIRIICAISKEHLRAGTPSYRFVFHPHQCEFLEGRKNLALGEEVPRPAPFLMQFA